MTEVTTRQSWGSGKKDESLRGAFISCAELSGPQGSWSLLRYISPGVGGLAPGLLAALHRSGYLSVVMLLQVMVPGSSTKSP